jgi:hypothetical protein
VNDRLVIPEMTKNTVVFATRAAQAGEVPLTEAAKKRAVMINESSGR